MTYDPVANKAMLFGGGHPTSGLFADTWHWDGAGWAQLATPAAPPARFNHGLAFDRRRGQAVLFGGENGSLLGDTWLFDGTTWTQAQPATSPPPLTRHGMAYDEARDRVVLFAMNRQAAPVLQIWEWDGASWALLATDLRISFDWPMSVTYDAARQRVVLYTGSGSNDATYEWNGTVLALANLAPAYVAPEKRTYATITYDRRRERIVMYGGVVQNQSGRIAWDYFTTVPASYAPFGAGCSGTAGVPTLAADNGARPWLASSFLGRFDRVPPNAPVSLALGVSRTSWLALTLPFDLGTIGMPGCRILASGEAVLGLAASAGTARFSIPIPNAPSLLGQSFYDQAFVVDAGANPAGYSVSNAAEGRIGAR